GRRTRRCSFGPVARRSPALSALSAEAVGRGRHTRRSGPRAARVPATTSARTQSNRRDEDMVGPPEGASCCRPERRELGRLASARSVYGFVDRRAPWFPRPKSSEGRAILCGAALVGGFGLDQ